MSKEYCGIRIYVGLSSTLKTKAQGAPRSTSSVIILPIGLKIMVQSWTFRINKRPRRDPWPIADRPLHFLEKITSIWGRSCKENEIPRTIENI
jgi:hypothetical protein